MSIAGYPKVFNVATPNGSAIQVQVGPTGWLKVRNTHATVVSRMYFTAADAAAGTNFVTLPVAAAATPNGEWEGPVRVNQGANLNPDGTGGVVSDRDSIWLAGVTGAGTVDVVALSYHK